MCAFPELNLTVLRPDESGITGSEMYCKRIYKSHSVTVTIAPVIKYFPIQQTAGETDDLSIGLCHTTFVSAG